MLVNGKELGQFAEQIQGLASIGFLALPEQGVYKLYAPFNEAPLFVVADVFSAAPESDEDIRLSLGDVESFLSRAIGSSIRIHLDEKGKAVVEILAAAGRPPEILTFTPLQVSEDQKYPAEPTRSYFGEGWNFFYDLGGAVQFRSDVTDVTHRVKLRNPGSFEELREYLAQHRKTTLNIKRPTYFSEDELKQIEAAKNPPAKVPVSPPVFPDAVPVTPPVLTPAPKKEKAKPAAPAVPAPAIPVVIPPPPETTPPVTPPLPVVTPPEKPQAPKRQRRTSEELVAERIQTAIDFLNSHGYTCTQLWKVLSEPAKPPTVDDLLRRLQDQVGEINHTVQTLETQIQTVKGPSLDDVDFNDLIRNAILVKKQ